MTYDPKKREYNKKYLKESYSRINLALSVSDHDEIRQAAAAAGEKVNEYIKNAVKARIAAEKADTSETDPPEKS